MKTIRVLGSLIILLFLGLVTVNAQAQQPDGALIQRFLLPANTPPMTSDMPYPVMQGYVIGDSIARGLSLAKRDSVNRGFTYSDTMVWALSYLYQMVDYDPIRFHQWGTYRPSEPYYPSPPAVLRNLLIDRTTELYPDRKRTAMLSAADVIAHIKVATTPQSKIDTTAAHARTAVVVTSGIIEPIKGKQIPKCFIDSKGKDVDHPTIARALVESMGSQAAVPGACLQFEYRLEWSRLNHGPARTSLDSTLVDGNGRQWIERDGEYIVFLRFLALGRSDGYHMAVLIPISWFGTTCSMYPIRDGVVYDPYDDFGFGTGLTPEAFKQKLREKISTIVNP